VGGGGESGTVDGNEAGASKLHVALSWKGSNDSQRGEEGGSARRIQSPPPIFAGE
jgi:hypothetical protein